MNLARHAVLFGLLLFNLSPSLRGQSGTQDKAQILKLVVVAELESSGYKPAEGVCFSTREKPAVEKELVRSLRASKLSIVQLGIAQDI